MSSFKEFYLKLFATWLFFMVCTVLCGYILYLLMNIPGIGGLILSVIFIFVILVICLVLFSNTKVRLFK